MKDIKALLIDYLIEKWQIKLTIDEDDENHIFNIKMINTMNAGKSVFENNTETLQIQ